MLETLVISNNNITNFDFLSDLTALCSLDVSNTAIVNTTPLANLPIVVLNASNTSIGTVKDICKLTNLTSLEIANTDITSIAQLSAIPNLDYIDISGCNITDLTSLKDFKGLYTLRAIGLSLPEIAYANGNEVMVVTE